MKNVKRVFGYAICIVLALVLCGGCGNSTEGSGNDKNPEKTYRIVEIDSCEYIYISRRPFGGNMAITHKGNCKYCKKERQQINANEDAELRF